LYRVINKMGRSYRRGGQEEEKEEMKMNSMPEDSESSSDEEKPKVKQSMTGLNEMDGGRHRRSRGRHTLRVPKGVHVKAKTLKRMLKSKGLKTTGKKSTLRSRARKAHLIGGSA
jgi:hypothetical protein